MVERGRGGTLLPALCSVVMLVGCSTSQPKAATTTSESSTATSVAASSDIDLARLEVVRDAFPSGFMTAPPSAPTATTRNDALQVGNTVSYGRPFIVDPPQCRALLQPVAGQAGGKTKGVGAVGPDEQVINISVDDPVTVPAGLPLMGCTRMSFDVDDDAVITNGVADRLPAPSIEGAATTALKVTTTGYRYAEYFYVAILGGRTLVQVTARVHRDFPPEPALPDLLVKGVAAVRGR